MLYNLKYKCSTNFISKRFYIVDNHMPQPTLYLQKNIQLIYLMKVVYFTFLPLSNRTHPYPTVLCVYSRSKQENNCIEQIYQSPGAYMVVTSTECQHIRGYIFKTLLNFFSFSQENIIKMLSHKKELKKKVYI